MCLKPAFTTTCGVSRLSPSFRADRRRCGAAPAWPTQIPREGSKVQGLTIGLPLCTWKPQPARVGKCPPLSDMPLAESSQGSRRGVPVTPNRSRLSHPPQLSTDYWLSALSPPVYRTSTSPGDGTTWKPIALALQFLLGLAPSRGGVRRDWRLPARYRWGPTCCSTGWAQTIFHR